MYSCWVGFDVTGTGGSYSQPVASINVLDSTFNSVNIPVLTAGFTTIVLDNVQVLASATGIIVGQPGGPTILPWTGDTTITSWALGRSYLDLNSVGGFGQGNLNPAPSKSGMLLDSNGAFVERSKSQYESFPASLFLNVKSAGATGDSVTDDTAALNSAFQSAAASSLVVFIPFGVYKVTGTIFIPVGSRIVGEAWPQIMGTGSFFADATSPKVMVQVGNAGDPGVIEISDMLFTVSGPTAGAILMEWNVKQGDNAGAAMWDSHFRVGGAAGSNLQSADCPKLTGQVSPNCMAASLLLHLTPSSSGYFENIWVWVADHDIDNPAQTQIDIYAGRGILIESQGPTWLYGTASEHAVLYQYQLANAANIFMGLIQTESPYFQSSPPAPSPYPFSQAFAEDPKFETCLASSTTCAMSWALRIIKSNNVYIYGAGLYR